MDNQNNKNKGPNNNRQGWGIILFTTLLITFIVMGLFSLMRGGTPEEISYDKFLKLVDNKKVESVTFTNSRINIVLTDSARKEKLKGTLKEVKDESKKSSSSKESTEKSSTSDSSKDSSSSAGENGTYDLISQLQEQMQDSGDTEEKDPDYYTGLVNDETLVEKLKKGGVQFKAEVPDTAGSLITELVITVVPIILMVLLFAFFMKRMTKGGGMMGIGKSNAKMYMEKQTGVTFQNVAGQDEAKESLQEVVDFLHNPEKYSGIGAKLPKGALLVGPPGTGKTLLAKAVAGEAGVPFFSLSGSAFVEMYVGVGASRVRDLFKQAQQMAPCIVFIDEIDAIGKTRDTAMGGNDEREQTLNQLLAEMDGFDTNKGLLVLAATNRPEVLDPALLRPGRFDRRIIVDKPDLKGRVDVLKVHAKDVKMDESVNLEEIALATSGAVGSDLANMINEAAINAVKNGRQVVSQKDLFEAVEALCEAAENGKEVVVLVELRARFDEENNIRWSRMLEQAGCQIIYGLEGYKVHSKLCLITRRSEKGIEYITQIGTGNYNEKTARLYTDLCLMTVNEQIGMEAARVFQALTKGEIIEEVDHLMVAPKCLQSKVIALIDEEIRHKKQGEDAYIGLKLNSLTDKRIIDKLVEASKAGVRVDMIIRGICCMVPGIKGETENVHIISIVGRFLEHSRIYIFGCGERTKYYIGSADFMTRNTVKRVEVAAPVYSEKIKKRIRGLFDLMLSDNKKARTEDYHGKYSMIKCEGQPCNSQEMLYQEAYDRAAIKTENKVVE